MSNHPGYIPDEEIVKSEDCGCRAGHWCAAHRNQAEADAGKAAQEREVARREAEKRK
jgi:hypothetical protein